MPQVVQANRKSSEGAYDPERDRVPGRDERARMLMLPHQVAGRELPALPLGQHLWQMSGQVQPDPLFKGFSGRYGRTDVVYFRRNGRQFVKPYTAPRDPKTSRQLDQRARFGMARIEWRTLTSQQRSAWEDFTGKHVAPELDAAAGERRVALCQRARNLFTSCQMQRTAWGDPMRGDAPSRPKPGGVWSIHEVRSPEGTYAFRIQHTERDLTGMKVLLEMSPAAKTPAHKPMSKHLTRAGQTDAGSFFPLGVPETVYVLESPRHAISPGQRYLVRAAILTDDGLKGAACEADLIRQEPGEIPSGDAATTGGAARMKHEPIDAAGCGEQAESVGTLAPETRLPRSYTDLLRGPSPAPSADSG